MMKKILALLLVLAIGVIGFAACTPNGSETESATESTPAAKTTVRLAGMTGPTSMGMVKMLHDSDAGTTANDYDFSIYTQGSEILPLLAQGKLDLAAVPSNLAATYYNNSNGSIQILAVNTLGVLYLLEKGDSVHSLEDLRGKTIYAAGKGAVPEHAFRYLLTQNGIDPETDVTINWCAGDSAATEVQTALLNGTCDVALLPQPAATVAINVGAQNGATVRIAVDVQEEWAKLETGFPIVTGVLIGRRAFIEENPEAIADFLAEYEASINYVADPANAENASQWIEQYGIFGKAAIAKKALPYCDIEFMSGAEMKSAASAFINLLYTANPQSVGGKLPDDGIYYVEE